MIAEYESDPESNSPQSTLQYNYAKIHLNLIKQQKSFSPKPYFGTYDRPVEVHYLKTLSLQIIHLIAYVLAGYALLKIVSPKPPKSTIAEKVSVTFKDVKGIDDCVKELQEVVNLLKNPEKYRAIGAKVPRGILLTGEPGVGKTLMAKAIAGEAQVHFLSTSGTEFEEVFVGVGAKRIRELFANAKELAPSIIFIDEIDSVGESRKGKFSIYQRQSLNQLLVEMDGFDTKDSVIVIAATNMPDRLDEALKRPGRFDKTIDVPVPALKARQDIAQLYLEKIKCDQSVNSEDIAKSTYGMTGADLANIINTAMQLALKDGRNECSAKDLENAKDRIILGIAHRSVDDTSEDKISASLYEAAKVVTIINSKGTDPLHKTTIIKRGKKIGKTSQLPDKDKVGMNKLQVLSMLDVKISGKVMHDLEYPDGKRTSLCENDMVQVTEMTQNFVRQGLFDELFELGYFDEQRDMGERLREKADQVVKIILQERYERVKRLLVEKQEVVRMIANALAEKETLTKDEVLEIVEKFNSKKV